MPEQQQQPNDPGDFTEQYNTALPPQEENIFRNWAQKNGMTPQLYDYDLRGWWKSEGGGYIDPLKPGSHMTDAFKKPNHPTFSDESVYHGVDGWQGGHWTAPEGGPTAKGGWVFNPGATRMYSDQELDNYFRQVEGGNSWQHGVGTGGSRFYDPNAMTGMTPQEGIASRLKQQEAGMEARESGTLPPLTGELPNSPSQQDI